MKLHYRIQIKTIMKLLVLVLINLIYLSECNKNEQLFLKYIKQLNKNYNDPRYFCSTSNLTKPEYWVLRNKKCMSFSSNQLSFSDANQVCNKNPYSYSYLLHKNELEYLQKNHLNESIGIDFFNLYSKLFRVYRRRSLNDTQRIIEIRSGLVNDTINRREPIEFSMWLSDVYYNGHECDKVKGYVSSVKFDELKCRNGCLQCVPNNKKTKSYFVCVKLCDWKVSYDSFCNTELISKYYVDENLYFQANEQTYVCQGDLKCINFSCRCPLNKKLKDKFLCSY